MIHWQLVIKEFGTNIQHISGVENMLSDMLDRLPYSTNYQEEMSTIQDQSCANKLFVT